MSAVPSQSSVLPAGFLWGASTAGHQIEGSNVASDFWALETLGVPLFAEPSGDACDSYHLVAAHERARVIVRKTTTAQVGWAVAMQAFQARPGNEAPSFGICGRTSFSAFALTTTSSGCSPTPRISSARTAPKDHRPAQKQR